MEEMDRRIDSQYYEVVPPGSLASLLLVKARKRIYQDFMQFCHPSTEEEILDVGVSDVVGLGDNVLERSYPHQEQITAVGLGDGADFMNAFPAVRYIKIEQSKALPFSDKRFPIAFCNAVIEHVGSLDKQRQFVDELKRVAARVFLVAPNRYFPVEHHTAIPILNWTDSGFRLACKIFGKTEWAREENLILMSKRSLRALSSPGYPSAAGYTGIRMGLFSSNIYLVLDDFGSESAA